VTSDPDIRPALRVALVTEQLLQDTPGGIGEYVRVLMRRLPPLGIELEPVVGLHRSSALSDNGVPHARRLSLPRRILYRRWMAGRGPALGGSADVVHAPSLAFPPRDERPLVVTVHDVLFLEHPELYTDRGVDFHKAMVERISEADMVICPSKVTAESLSKLERPPKQVRVIPMGADIVAPPEADRAEILDRLGIERPYVLWLGTLEPRKNPEGVVRGFVGAVESNVPDADSLKLYLVGPPGWWSGDVRDLIDTKGMSDRVRRIDYQPGEIKAALYAEAAAFLFPSLAEGFGLPVVEAMACGAPVVTSNRSSLPEVAGSAAELCDPEDSSSIAQALAKVLRDPDLAADLRRLGFRRAKEFTWDRTVRETLACYEELASGAGGKDGPFGGSDASSDPAAAPPATA
jgi:glycosyltransferase involved in cell wall biosynthesis